MRQRVSIARTFTLNPPLLLADEAFSALDEITAAALRNDLLSMIGGEKKTTIFITHSVTEAAELAERVLVFGRPGCVLAEVKAKDLIDTGGTYADVTSQIRDSMKMARSTSMHSVVS